MPYKDKEINKIYHRKWMADRRREFFKDKQCSKCLSKENLELHHKDPSTKIDHKIWSWSKEKQEKELLKCDILCKKCHKIISNNHMKKAIKHGTHSGYAYYGCRCNLCTKAQSEYGKNWKKNKFGE